MRRLALVGILALLAVAMPPFAMATVEGPNGRVAFRGYLNDAHTQGALFTVRPGGTGLIQLTHPPRGVITTEPDWSPNGRWIAYQREQQGHSTIFKIRRNGSDRVDLSKISCTEGCFDEGFPAWSPDGKSIAVQRDTCSTGATNLLTIYVMRADGTGARRVTQATASCATSHRRYASIAPQWAPDGQRLVFERVDSKRERHAVFTVRLDGSGLRRLTPWRLDASQPDWSPNGRWIAFRTQEGSETRGNIALVHPNGSGLHRITHGGHRYKWLSCSFSPNGEQITAARVPGSGTTDDADVYIMHVDGSARTNITHSTNAWESAPDWGPRPE